ncbi:conserved hypothetical protein [Ricinus communis]|uniref:Uncharacterized protein n=1 Tax=Ricinus communis TaxID=3988 RepID=B9SXS4_RICCO|nr:conserved hypothetical protein [Ricinus communis]
MVGDTSLAYGLWIHATRKAKKSSRKEGNSRLRFEALDLHDVRTTESSLKDIGAISRGTPQLKGFLLITISQIKSKVNTLLQKWNYGS